MNPYWISLCVTCPTGFGMQESFQGSFWMQPMKTQEFGGWMKV